MKLFKDLTDKTEDMMEFKKKQDHDDEMLKEYFLDCSHKEFVSAMINIGTLFDIISTYCSFLDMNSLVNTTKSRDRKINKALNDLNKRINLEYDFDEEITIVQEGVLYQDEIYLFINKCQFIKIMEVKKLSQ